MSIQAMKNWIIENYQWFFSGAGITFICFLIGYIKYLFIKKRKSKNINSTRIAIDKSLILEGKVKGNINTGDTNEFLHT